jgi:Protein of unknown function (DUF3237)
VRFKHEELTIWYGTADAPAPIDGSVEARRGVSVTVGIQPPSPCNIVTVQYRVDHGQPCTARGIRLRTDYSRGIEYHRAVLPDLWTGSHVDYVPIVSCSGRCAPAPQIAASLPSWFSLTNVPLSVEREERDLRLAPTRDRTPPALEYLASIRVPLREPEIIGITPGGLLVNWFWDPNEGEVSGPKLKAKVRKSGGDWMTIRRDGIGVMDVRATVETDDGALLMASYLGTCDFGEAGYKNFLDHRWPEVAPTRTAPRIQTSHPRYLELNRLQCIGIGQVRMKELVYTYDLYALR